MEIMIIIIPKISTRLDKVSFGLIWEAFFIVNGIRDLNSVIDCKQMGNNPPPYVI